MTEKEKTPLDYVPRRDPLVPVQVRLPGELVEAVKEKLSKNELTFTDLVKGACLWYLNDVKGEDDPIREKKANQWRKK